MKYAMFYTIAPDGSTNIADSVAAHRERLDEFHTRGVLLMAGPLGNPPEGALGIFTSREAAEEFVRDDPFVINGIVSGWRVVEWNEIFS